MVRAEIEELGRIIAEAKQLASRYRRITGKPLGVTAEVAEYEAARFLGLELRKAREPGYDAVEGSIRYQIKGRCAVAGSRTQRVGRIKFDYPWDFVLLVILDEDLEPLSIHKACRADIKIALERPGSKARNLRGQLSVSTFQRLAEQVWPTR